MSFLGAVPETTATSAQAVGNEFLRSVKQAQDNTHLSTEGRRAVVARAYLRAVDKMAMLKDSVQTTKVNTAEEISRELFGSAASFGADAISARDADDRADQIKSASEAIGLLHRAETNGDPVLVRAIALRAYNEANSPLGAAWAPVLETYLDRRPQAAAKLQELTNARRTTATDSFATALTFAVLKPSELNGLNDVQIRAAAESAQAVG